MKLKEHCQTVASRLSKDLVIDPDSDDDKKIIKLIKARLGKHHIPMNVLRAYASIYLFQNAGHKGITMNQLKAIMLEEDIVIESDITQSLNRLQVINIIRFDGKKYSLNNNG